MCRALAAALVLVLGVSSVADAAIARIRSYRELPYGPCRFVQEQFGVTSIDRFQEEALVAFGDPAVRRISLQAAAGVGKSAVMSWCAWWFLGTQGAIGDHPNGLVTGVTDSNLRDNFWKEMAKWQLRSPWLSHAFKHEDRRIVSREFWKTWFLGRRAFSKSGSPEEQGATLSGLHGGYVAAFVDESGSIPTTVGRAAEQALSDGPAFGKIMQAGNPISLDGMLYEAATKKRGLYVVIVVTNDPDDPRRAKRGDIEWAREQIALYGRDNPWVMSYILGMFPPSSINTLLGIEDVLAAQNRQLDVDAYNWAQKRLGIDVARFGDDRTVLFPRQGLRAFKPHEMRIADTMQIAARASQAIDKWHPELVIVDDTGHWGHGVIDALTSAADGKYVAVGVNFAEKAFNPRYSNRRTEGWIEMAKWVKGGAWLPNVPPLVDELITPTYTFVNGKLQLEEKDQIKKRLGRSPDVADALATTFMLPDMPAGVELPAELQQLAGVLGLERTAANTQYDEFSERRRDVDVDAGSGHAATDYDPYGSRS